MKYIKYMLAIGAGVFVWSKLPEHRKLQLRFILKQVPYLPGRYMV
jgi:hypothetical protein